MKYKYTYALYFDDGNRKLNNIIKKIYEAAKVIDKLFPEYIKSDIVPVDIVFMHYDHPNGDSIWIAYDDEVDDAVYVNSNVRIMGTNWQEFVSNDN